MISVTFKQNEGAFLAGVLAANLTQDQDVDMINADNRRDLFDHLREEMKEDRAKHKILPPSKFGLIQITRQRVRPERNIKTREEDPSGSGEVEAPIVLIQKIYAHSIHN